MAMIDAVKKRRSIYILGRDLPISEDEVLRLIEKATECTPDSYNMKSARVVVALGEKHEQLWDLVYDTFEGKVPRAKIDNFRKAYGTILYFRDMETVHNLEAKYELYAPKFNPWSNQACGMLQITMWNLLADVGIGANLQHYNPIIDEAVRKMFDLPEAWELNAQMPFGSIEGAPKEKVPEDIGNRVKIFRS